MNTNLLFDFSIDRENRKVQVKREFAAPLETVWAAWTQSDILDQWWAPKPWKAQTKSMDLRPGGKWLYAMVSPEGEKHWSFNDYQSVENQKSFSANSAFSDENGNVTAGMPQSNWTCTFTSEDDDTTLVDIMITYDNTEDLDKEIEMGFKEGFTMGLNQLDALLASQK